MSLKLWLPLRGDLHNQGLYNLPDPSISSLTWDDAGKLGQCVNNTAIWHLTDDIIGNVWSVALWLNNRSGTWASSNNIIFCKNGSSSSDTHIYFSILGGTSLAVGINGSASTLSYAYTFVANTWYHLAATYDGTNLSLYINGEQVKTGESTREYTSGRNNIGLHCRSSAAAGTSRTGQVTAYYSNDLRLYDHCLSKAEVKEISQALILHYKLDNPIMGINPNLFKVTPRSYSASSYGAYDLNLTENLVAGKTYTIQLWDVTVSHTGKTAGNNLGIWVYWGGGSVNLLNWSGTTFSTGYSAYVSKTFTVTSSQASGSGTSNSWLRLYNSVPSATGTMNMKVGKWKIEEGDKATPWCTTSDEMDSENGIIYDSSGYNHRTVSNNITNIADSARYKLCTVFNGTDSWIKCDTTDIFAQYAPELTINTWVYSDNYTTALAAGGRVWSCTETGGFNIEGGSSGYVRFPVYVATNADHTSHAYKYSNTAVQLSALTAGWHMFTVVYTLEGTKVYVDAELQNENTAVNYGIKFNTNSRFHLGCEANGATASSPYFNGKISDFRWYYTALNEEDIEDLYHTPLSIDNSEKMHVFELEEDGGRELIQGINLTTSYSIHADNGYTYSGYNEDGEIYLSGNSSVGSMYIPVSPTGKTYYYDIELSADASNQRYIGFERYDAAKTATSNNSCAYIISTNAAQDHVRYKGTIDLSKDANNNPTAFIALRILNDWSSGTTRKMTIHHLSLREVTTLQKQEVHKDGTLLTDEFRQYKQSSFYKNGFIEATDFIEK